MERERIGVNRVRGARVLGPATWVSVLAIGLAAAACRGEKSSSAAVVRDSLGVQIVENTDDLWPEGGGWRLSDQPILDIGVLEGDPFYQFDQVVGGKRLSDGRIAVANAGSFELRYYDAEGKHLLSTGREGGGPGEFGGIMSLRLMPGDSLLVYDYRYQRASCFDENGRLARTVVLQFAPEMGGYPIIVAPFEDASLLVGVRSFVGLRVTEPGVAQDKLVLVHSDAQGRLIDTLAVLPGGDFTTRVEGGRLQPLGERPFGRYPSHDVYRNGAYYGRNDHYEIDYYDSDGRLLRSIRRAQPSLVVTAADVERERQRRLEQVRNESQRQFAERLLQHARFPETFPAYSDFVVDDVGNLWVKEYLKPGDDQPRWTVFDVNGQMLGLVLLPNRFTVLHIGSDFVLGVWRDDVGVEHVQLFELSKE